MISVSVGNIVVGLGARDTDGLDTRADTGKMQNHYREIT